jgi:putative transposase
MQYRRANTPGASYFFTLATHQRQPWLTQNDTIVALRDALQTVRIKHPFALQAYVILPDHLHCIWRMPGGDADFSTRWMLIKQHVTRQMRQLHPQVKIWQDRFWEHQIRDDADFEAHCHYIHYNPVKHGHAAHPADWPHSSLPHLIAKGVYAANWGAGGLDAESSRLQVGE